MDPNAWNYGYYGGTLDHYNIYPTQYPPQALYPANYQQIPVAAPTPNYGPYGTLIASPVSQNVSAKGHMPTYSTDTAHLMKQQPLFKQDGSQKTVNHLKIETAVGPKEATTSTTTTGFTYKGLDDAVYKAAKSYLAEKQHVGSKASGGGGGGVGGGNWSKERFRSGRGPVIDPNQWKYCELCKCTCAGELAYKAHIQGKAHKKKESQGNHALILSGSKGHMYCQLCDVSCSSSDAYASHIRGAKHQKILRVQTKMGKNIPDEGTGTTAGSSSASAASSASPAKKVIVCPRINFVGGQTLNSTMSSKSVTGAPSTTTTSADPIGPTAPPTYASAAAGFKRQGSPADEDSNETPVGLEYVLESMNETNTAIQFYCKLCECSFSDPHAKYVHSKGRRHRLQYKKKVDPTLKVDSVPSYLDRLKGQWKNKRKGGGGGMTTGGRGMIGRSDMYRQQAETLKYEKELLQWQLMKTATNSGGGMDAIGGSDSVSGAGRLFPSTYQQHLATDVDSCFNLAFDNQHMVFKHNSIYPTEHELSAVQEFVSTCERSLKLVSDELNKLDNRRILKGVMRVGLLAKGLLIRDALQLELVILTSEKPTKKLLLFIAENMPKLIATFSTEKYAVEISPDVTHLKIYVPTVEEDTEQEQEPTATTTTTNNNNNNIDNNDNNNNDNSNDNNNNDNNNNNNVGAESNADSQGRDDTNLKRNDDATDNNNDDDDNNNDKDGENYIDENGEEMQVIDTASGDDDGADANLEADYATEDADENYYNDDGEQEEYDDDGGGCDGGDYDQMEGEEELADEGSEEMKEEVKKALRTIVCYIFVAPNISDNYKPAKTEKESTTDTKATTTSATTASTATTTTAASVTTLTTTAGTSFLPGLSTDVAVASDQTVDSTSSSSAGINDGNDYIDEPVCAWALTELKRTKWFHNTMIMNEACTVLIRVLIDFCKRIPTWTPMGQWTLELLVERCMSLDHNVSPAVGLRRVFEIVSSGIFLRDGWGLLDPLNRPTNRAEGSKDDLSNRVDASDHMCTQEKEDVTNSAQHALRLIAHGQIYKVLGISKLPPPAPRPLPSFHHQQDANRIPPLMKRMRYM
ncbi:hypothetical protein HELRODRAFT_101626 [Helobdella robusta]|uniref:DZF domain-containing protein n=1 Tax=Helobdella robusta TaxID=6412 RepID=T1ED59_HELRO|nr:hypothetical protein HELRODRAFT_101626 [Helobdella robusta]ESN98446.1 hypothetical protein HELRODRAFT_101626 [Helobdella robusta]